MALIAAALALAGCGGSSHFADKPRPPSPINLSVYVNDKHVSVSPASVGAGPVDFLVTNSASGTELVTVKSSGDGHTAASTGPINPGTTAQVQADLGTGSYTVSVAAANSSFGGPTIRPAQLRIGKPRANGNNAILQP